MPRVASMRQRDNQARGCRDQGSASLWVLTLSALVLLTGGFAATLTAVGADRTRAAAAADLAALAAAQHLADGSACQWAREAALRNSASLGKCQAGFSDVTVTVRVPVRLPFSRLPAGASVSASARAGPRTDGVTDHWP